MGSHARVPFCHRSKQAAVQRPQFHPGAPWRKVIESFPDFCLFLIRAEHVTEQSIRENEILVIRANLMFN
jgi:hypothetical protein